MTRHPNHLRQTIFIYVSSMLCLTALTACGLNIFAPMASKSSDRVKLEEARTQIDQQDYADATATLESVENDSNEKRLLQVAALLGSSGLNIWTIITDIIDASSSDASGGSVDNIFDQISDSVLGTDDTRTTRMTSLVTSINLLKDAPQGTESRVKNLSCFLAGILATPTIADGTAAISATSLALLEVASSSTGAGATAAECPNLSNLDAGLTAISEVQENFSLILEVAQGCSFLNIGDTGDSLNKIEESLAKFTNNADQGCSSNPSCSGVACAALKLGCVNTLINATPSTADDGDITSCELVQNCIDPGSCF